MNPSIHPISSSEARKRINVLCWYYPALLSTQCGERRLSKAAYLAVASVSDYSPPSQYFVRAHSGNWDYMVDSEEKTCECQDHQNGFICKHRLAVACHTHAPQLIARLEKENPIDADDVYRGLFVECNLEAALS